MVLNTSAKGRKKEKECADELERRGYTVEFRSQRLRWGRIDLGYRPTKGEQAEKKAGRKLKGWKAAKFDVEAIKEGVIIRVSVKNSEFARKAEEFVNILEYRKRHKLELNVLTQLWIWHKPRWRGRGAGKHWEDAHWEELKIE